MEDPSKRSQEKEEKGKTRDQENLAPETPEDLPFSGLPYSYEGRFMALFQEEQVGNAEDEKKMAGEIAYLNSTFSSLAGFKVVPLLAVLAVVLLVSPFLVKALIEGRWNQRAPGNRAVELGSPKESIRMTEYLAPIKDGFVEVPLQLVEEKKLVSFYYSRDGESVPLLAYSTPAGKFGTVVGFSRPCQSEQFHLEGDEIVCDLCHTRWELESLNGVEGDCQGESLERVPHYVYRGRLIIRETDVQEKKPQIAGEGAWISA